MLTLSGDWGAQLLDDGILLTQPMQTQSKAQWSKGLSSLLASLIR